MASPYVLAVMGVTGAGKSTFIKLATGDSGIKVGHSLRSETTSISSYEVSIRGRKFTLVDTPGFDDLCLTDSDVLQMLVNWLAREYSSGKKLNGILYLHRITDFRMRGSSLRNFNMFKELIGEAFYRNVTLGTTCWSLVPFHVASSREMELKSSSVFWSIMLSKGARLERISDDATEARNLIYEIASHDSVILQAQREMVDFGKSFSSLTVAKMVDYEVGEVRKQMESEINTLREERTRQEEELARKKHRNMLRQNRILMNQQAQTFCVRKMPFGTCDRRGCNNRLQKYRVTWHCCLCNSTDNYWYCGPCGNDCGNLEHPTMSRIDNEDDCVIL